MTGHCNILMLFINACIDGSSPEGVSLFRSFGSTAGSERRRDGHRGWACLVLRLKGYVQYADLRYSTVYRLPRAEYLWYLKRVCILLLDVTRCTLMYSGTLGHCTVLDWIFRTNMRIRRYSIRCLYRDDGGRRRTDTAKIVRREHDGGMGWWVLIL